VGTLRSRLLHVAAVLLAVSIITFTAVQVLPGDLAVTLAGDGASAEEVAALRTELGLDAPAPLRYGHWLLDVLRGDLGQSAHSGESVGSLIGARLPVSLELMLLAQFVALGAAVPAALYGATHPGGFIDRTGSAAAFVFVALPSFALGVLLIYLFAVRLQWLPATGYVAFTDDPLGNLRALVLPALTLGVTEAPIYLRTLRADTGDTLRRPFIRAARAKGLPERRVLLVHALRPSSLTLVTLIALNVGHLMAGAVIVETLFALPGVGRLLINAIEHRDLVVVQGVVLCAAVTYVFANLGADAAYTAIDPRIRHGESPG
jgi:peptide/nickel transport system permease protein